MSAIMCWFLPMRRYASALLAITLCQFIWLSQTGIVSKQLDESKLFLPWRLPLTYHTVLQGNSGASEDTNTFLLHSLSLKL